MSSKKRMSQKETLTRSQIKRHKNAENTTYLQKVLEESGLTLKQPPEKSIAFQETIHIIRNIKKNLQNHFDYPRNALELISNLTNKCQDMNVFKHYLFPNIVRSADDSASEHMTSDSVLKILLSVPILQSKLIDYIFSKAMDLAVDSQCMPWIQMILKCISSLDSIVNSEAIAKHLINLLDISNEKIVRLEIITAIPDILGDQEHNNVALELCRILGEDHDLIPAILDCVSYLNLSDEQHEQMQKKTLNILFSLSKCNYFPNFVKILLIPGRMNETGYLEAVLGLRNVLGWPTSLATSQEIASSQVLTATAIRNSMISSKLVSNAWLKAVTNCKESTDHKSIDFIIILILYTTSEERQRQLENVLKKQIKLNILKEDLMDEVFEKYKPILKDYLKHFCLMTNTLLKAKADPIVQSFASHIYMLMLSHLDDYIQTIVAELLQLILDCKQCVMNILLILNNVASKDVSLLKPQSLQMLTLLDRMDDMTLAEVRAVMDLVCALAYSSENSVIRDDIHMVIRKELGSSSISIKIQGILAGIHAVKYLMSTNSNEHQMLDLPDDISYGSVLYLSEGDLREAAQIIELISRSTRQFPELIAFFYDELCTVINSANQINKHFLSWLTDAVTNDLQQNFIVDSIDSERIGELKLSMQYCLNMEGEMDEVIAINIAGLALKNEAEVSVAILSPLLKLVQSLHYKQHDGNLSSIDALLGCPIVMPKFNIDEIEDMENNTVCRILDCLLYCVNWFRELLNAFATQSDCNLKEKMIKRILQLEDMENLICQILLISKISYKPPNCIVNSYLTSSCLDKKLTKTQSLKHKVQQKSAQDDTVLPETLKSQASQHHSSVKSQLNLTQTLPLRKLTLNLLFLLNTELQNAETENILTVKSLKFLLKSTNVYLEQILVSKIKRHTFLSKQEEPLVYDGKKAEECAVSISKILPNLLNHISFITKYIEYNVLSRNEQELSIVAIEHLTCLENVYNMFTIYFKWIGFKNQHSALLKSSLRTIAGAESNMLSLKDCVLNIVRFFEKHEKYCLQITTAVSLVEFLRTLQEYSNDTTVSKTLRNIALNFLSQQWKTSSGVVEKGIIFNQSVDILACTYLVNNEVLALKTISLQLVNDIQFLKSKNDTLSTYKCISKTNFSVLYRNLGSALFEVTKKTLNKGLTNLEHLGLWKDVTTIMKSMSDICKTLENRNTLSVFFKKSLPLIKLFISQGLPIIEIQFKNDTQEILEILKLLQQSTRFLQSLCCHSRLKKDAVLISKVPYVRQLLETLIYKVKAVLVANNCSEAFWMGNLKNKNIHGEVIQTQQSVVSEESVEDCDDQLPEDEDNEDSDEEMLNPDSKSISDIV
ncbi:unnamed protein product [Parnassius apollo]|uniref:(apollo) hypothetical protein n=1 Tax=Parnassius apollo TaxID=110799 RepID=A0A8S3XPG9_PARAO|nr:unnamed protein product [Parnassius apollo]